MLLLGVFWRAMVHIPRTNIVGVTGALICGRNIGQKELFFTVLWNTALQSLTKDARRRVMAVFRVLRDAITSRWQLSFPH
jgi:hypothetical protein